MDTNHSPNQKRNQLNSSSAALRWILSMVFACGVACAQSKSAVADAPSTDDCPGRCYDLNGDRVINLSDFAVFAGCYSRVPSVSLECTCSDFDGDGRIDLQDFALFAGNLGQVSVGYAPDCQGAPAQPFPDREKSEEILALEVVFDQQLQTPTYYSGDTPLEEVLIEQSHSGLSYTYYNLQIRLDGIISMYEASGRKDHFLLALELCENMVAAANEDRDGDGHPEWDATYNGNPPPGGHPDLLLPDLQGSVAIARMARLIITDPVLQAKYGSRAYALARFVDDHILTKWLYDRNHVTWFRNLPDWSDKASMIVRLLVDMHVFLGDQVRRELAEELAQQFVDTALMYNPDTDSYVWPNVPGPDTAHTNREAMFIEVCAQAGIVFNDNDVQMVANTLVNVIWNGSLDSPQCTNFHTGADDDYRGRGPGEWGLINNGWILTGRVSAEAQSIGQAIMDSVLVDPNINPTVYRSSGPQNVLPMSGHLARNLWLSQR